MIFLLFEEKVSTIINDSLATVEPVDYFSIMHYYWRLGIVKKKNNCITNGQKINH